MVIFYSYVSLPEGNDWLVVWNIFIFPYIGNFILPTDELIFFWGVGIPPASHGYRYKMLSVSSTRAKLEGFFLHQLRFFSLGDFGAPSLYGLYRIDPQPAVSRYQVGPQPTAVLVPVGPQKQRHHQLHRCHLRLWGRSMAGSAGLIKRDGRDEDDPGADEFLELMPKPLASLI